MRELSNNHLILINSEYYPLANDYFLENEINQSYPIYLFVKPLITISDR
jgi:hypothetical protein